MRSSYYNIFKPFFITNGPKPINQTLNVLAIYRTLSYKKVSGKEKGRKAMLALQHCIGKCSDQTLLNVILFDPLEQEQWSPHFATSWQCIGRYQYYIHEPIYWYQYVNYSYIVSILW